MWSHSMGTRLARKETGKKTLFLFYSFFGLWLANKIYNDCLFFFLEFFGSVFFIFFPSRMRLVCLI